MNTFESEVLRINERFLVEVVEAFGFCPWAEGARKTGALKRAVILDESEALERLLSLEEKTAVAILIYPRFSGPPAAFEELLARLRRAEEARRGARSPFVTALFHPALPWSGDGPDQLVPLLRRSPDPSLQFVRFAALEAVRSAAPSGKFLFDWTSESWKELARREQNLPVSARVARDNFSTVERVGADRMLAILDDIGRDREASYRRFRE